MHEIHSLLKIVGRRLECTSYLKRLHHLALVTGTLTIVLVVVDRLPAEPFIPWQWIIPVLVVGTILGALAWWWPNRRSTLRVAMTADEKLELREKLSTALHCHHRQDVFAVAAVTDAVDTARKPQLREKARRLFAVTAPKLWWLSPLLIIIALAASFLQQFNAFEKEKKNDPAVVLATKQVRDSMDTLLDQLEMMPELSSEIEQMLDEFAQSDEAAAAPRTAEDVKRDAIKKVTDLKDRAEEILNGERAKSHEAMKNSLSKLRLPDNGPASELADSLAKGDFKAAAKALETLKQQLEDGQLDSEAKKQLADQMQSLAQQLQQATQQQQQLQQALQQAGLNPKLAQNPAALQKALQNNQTLNQQQKQQISQLQQAQQQANQACQSLSQACQNMAQGAQSGQFGQMSQQAMQQLSQMEMTQQLLQQAMAAAKACQGQCNQMGQSMFLPDELMKGPGMGNWGQGSGGKAPIAKTPWKPNLIKADAPVTEGDIIASQFFQGQQVVGESQAKLRQILLEAEAGAEEGLGEELVHKRYEQAHMHYFGELKKLTEAKETAPVDTTGESGETTSSNEDSPAEKPDTGGEEPSESDDS